jgi:16S rRNA processing protein RimM
VAGRVGRPHGLDGSFHVIRPRADLLAEGAVLMVAGASREVVRRAGTDQRPILRLDGCEDRDAAEALRGEELRVRRADAPAREPGEYWAEELEGCRVQDGEVVVGVVRRLVALPSCEALEVAREDDTDLLVPLVRDAVRTVDPAARRIDVDLRFLGAA